MHDTGLHTERDCIMLPWKPWMDEWNVLRGSLRSYVARHGRKGMGKDGNKSHMQLLSEPLE